MLYTVRTPRTLQWVLNVNCSLILCCSWLHCFNMLFKEDAQMFTMHLNPVTFKLSYLTNACQWQKAYQITITHLYPSQYSLMLASVPLSILSHLTICISPNTPSPYQLKLFLLPVCFYLICRNVWFNTVLRCSQLTSIVQFYSPKTTTNIVQN